MTTREQQETNPYAPPQVLSDAEGPSTRRYPWIAVFLALFSPVFALLYAARVWRALGYLVAVPVVYLIALGLNAYVGITVNVAIAVAGVGLLLVGAVDGYRCARAWPESARLPWCARALWLVPIVIVGLLGQIALRAFVFEAFHIPAGSMLPTLRVGDYIAVSKSAYGLRLPEVDGRLSGRGAPARGEVVVFRYPENTRLNYIKRVIGVPGDRVEYHDKRLVINGRTVERSALDRDSADGTQVKRFQETLGGHTYTILIDPGAPPIELASVRPFASRERCEYNKEGFRCVVPAGNYFVMGDNRDGSSDSRYWGFVPDANLVGRAFMIWSSQRHPERIGLRIE
jgi:signal peptidase I